MESSSEVWELKAAIANKVHELPQLIKLCELYVEVREKSSANNYNIHEKLQIMFYRVITRTKRNRRVRKNYAINCNDMDTNAA